MYIQYSIHVIITFPTPLNVPIVNVDVLPKLKFVLKSLTPIILYKCVQKVRYSTVLPTDYTSIYINTCSVEIILKQLLTLDIYVSYCTNY